MTSMTYSLAGRHLHLRCAAVVLASLVWGACNAQAKNTPPIYAPKYRPLKVLIFTDIHYGEFEKQLQGDVQDSLSTVAEETLLDAEKPDLVVVLGDIVTGENLQTTNQPLGYVRAMLNPILKRRIPFASTYGNHDISRNLSRRALFEYDSSLPGSLTQRQTPPTTPGITNYVLPIHKQGPGSPVLAQLVFLDSQGVTGLNQPQALATGVNWVTAAQVLFLRKALKRFRVPTYVFVHIPVPQFQQLQDNFVQNGCVGLQAESRLTVQGKDEGLWASLLASEQVVGVFSGHVHGNGWCCRAARGAAKRSLAACFARHSGYGGYGDWPKAARVITINSADGRKFHTYVRGVDGTVSDAFTT